MDDRTFHFLEIMVALGLIGIVAFLIFLVSQFAKQRDIGNDDVGKTTPSEATWFAFILAAVAIVVAIALLVWQFFSGSTQALSTADWRSGNRAVAFTVVMLVVAVFGLVGFVVFVFAQLSKNASAKPAIVPSNTAISDITSDTVQTPEVHKAPGSVRLIGLLILAVGYLLINWIYLDHAMQHQLMTQIFYPAGFVVALVLLVDKATRTWTPKLGAESFREWILCSGLVLLLLLGYLNVTELADKAAYNAMFWDFLHVVLFLITFLLVDRTHTNFRFLVAYGYLILMPINFLIWRVMLGLPVVEGVEFWSSLWPFFILAIIFFVFEIISLIATRGSKQQIVPAVKDTLFVLVYAILLIIAVPEAAVPS